VIEAIAQDLGTVDLIIYSLASPRRTDPTDGQTYSSCLKPIGAAFTQKTLNTDKGEVLLHHDRARLRRGNQINRQGDGRGRLGTLDGRVGLRQPPRARSPHHRVFLHRPDLAYRFTPTAPSAGQGTLGTIRRATQ